MTAKLFFVPAGRLGESTAVLTGAEHRHLRAARIKAGDDVWLFDENGTRIRAAVEAISAASTRLRLLQREPPEESRLRVILVPAVLKNKAMDEVMERAAEWGVAEVRPVSSERTVVKLDEREDKKAERWRQIARAAAEQCKSGRIPVIFAPVPLSAVLTAALPGRKVVLSERGGLPLKTILASTPRPEGNSPDAWVLLIGPEGGWSDGELDAAADAGFEAGSLGSHILKAGTAALSAVAILVHERGL